MENTRNLAAGSQIAQVRPANTTAATAFTAILRTEITKIIVCETSGGAVTFRIFHDNSGSTYDQTTALYYDVALAANTTVVIEAASELGGITIAPDGTLGVRTSSNNAITFTVYGVTESRL